MIYPLKIINITQRFGEHPEVYAQFGLKGHNGIDFGCDNGTPVLAPCDGDLGFESDPINFGKGYGMNARIFAPYNKDGATRMELIFGHLKEYGTPGPIKQGDIIAWSDNTGFSTGPHLHFGIRLWNDSGIINYGNGYLGWIDPMPFLVKEIMTNTKLVKYGNEWGYYLPCTSPDALVSYGENFGKPIPRKADGSVDWDNLQPELTIN